MGSAASKIGSGGGGDSGPSTSSSSQSECPATSTSTSTTTTTFTGPAYDVYSRRIDTPSSSSNSSSACPILEDPRTAGFDPRNNMPRAPAQEPCAGQRMPLSTARAASSIPKAGVAVVVATNAEKNENDNGDSVATWTYPSPQMFFNALRRKGKGADVSERDMESVVSAHNAMNEATWRRVSAWERAMHGRDSAPCGGPKLSRFVGRPHDLSPLAKLEWWFGGSRARLPFDRHDWFVDRCGAEVRYVIDFYFDESRAGTPDAFDLRVRPALDSPTAALDRVKMFVYEKCAEYGLPCPVTGQASGKVASEMAEASSGKGR